METFPDLSALSDEELKNMIQGLADEEREISYRRRILHGRIDILRAELVNRVRREAGEERSPISGADIEQLSRILAGKGIRSDAEPR